MVAASAITCLVGLREAARDDGATVIHNLISSRAVPELLTAAGATPVRARVGHSFIKADMARLNAVFGGEHSAHFYFRDFFYADSGMLAAMHVLAALGTQSRPLSELLARLHAVRGVGRNQYHGDRRRRGDRSASLPNSAATAAPSTTSTA